MSNPGSPTPRGRGRGRWKEMSSNERVANWVNQREAKRLNKERWANHVTGSNTSAGDGGDVQLSTKQEGVELESSLDRSKAKRQNVPLYVPPSLRAKKESGTKTDHSDFHLDDYTGNGPDSDDRTQNGEIGNSSAVRASDGSCESEEQKSGARETSRSKGRGRGRKKPEVEIYVPRALRAAKHEGKSVPGTQGSNEQKYRTLCTEEIQQNTRSADCNIDRNALPSRSFTQSPDFSDALMSDEVSQNEIRHYSSSQLIHHYHAGDCDSLTNKVKYETNSSSVHRFESDAPVSSPLNHDSVIKKGKYETNISSVHQYESDAPVSSPPAHAISDEHPHIETAGNYLTFEFYDPAVIAFLPSTCSVLNSSDINMSYSVDNSRQSQSAPQASPLQQNVTVFSDSSMISSNAQAQMSCVNDDYQSQVSLEKDIEQSVLGVCEDTKKDTQQGRIDTTCAGMDGSIPSFSSEQMNVNDFSSCQNRQGSSEQMSMNDMLDSQTNQDSSEMLTVSVVDNCDQSVLTAGLGCEAYERLLEDSLTEFGSADGAGVDFNERILTTHSGQETYSCDSMLPKDACFPVQPTMETTYSCDSMQQKDVSSLIQPTMETTYSCDSMQQKDVSSLIQPTAQAVVDQLEGQGYHSDKHENDKPGAYSDGGDDGGDTWDALFNDNGDCLDDAGMEELTEYVGKVEIDKPKINYFNYEPKEAEMDYESFSHILEIHDFSPDLATCDLISSFREFSSRGFDVKWVDDTHALGIFSSSIAAKEALKMIHPLFKVRPLSEASKKGQSKARHCQEFLQPYKARPETTSIAARRLVAGALGMMPQVSKEVRELERKKLKEAKERRRQERQQKIDIWDGSFRKCAMDDENTDSR